MLPGLRTMHWDDCQLPTPPDVRKKKGPLVKNPLTMSCPGESADCLAWHSRPHMIGAKL